MLRRKTLMVVCGALLVVVGYLVYRMNSDKQQYSHAQSYGNENVELIQDSDDLQQVIQETSLLSMGTGPGLLDSDRHRSSY